MATVDDVYNIGVAFLDASVEALNKTPAGAPERAFVSPDLPALDCCDQLTVHNASLSEAGLQAGAGALSDAKRINRGGLAQATLIIQITRCVTLPKETGGKVTMPTPAELEADARRIDQDGWALWLGLNYALKHGELAQKCGGAERLGAQKMESQGGCGGWVFTYRYPIEGGILGT